LLPATSCSSAQFVASQHVALVKRGIKETCKLFYILSFCLSLFSVF